MNRMLCLGRNWETTISVEVLMGNIERIDAHAMNKERTKWEVFLDYTQIDLDGKHLRRVVSEILPSRASARRCRRNLVRLLEQHGVVYSSQPTNDNWKVGALKADNDTGTVLESTGPILERTGQDKGT